MASITQHGDKFRVQIALFGKRISRVFDTQPAAEMWAVMTEGDMKFRRQHAKQEMPRRVLMALETIPHRLSHVLDSVVKAPTSCGIYFLIKDMEVVYVGQSIDFFNRLSKHRREGKEFDAFSFIECDRAELDELEMKYILAFVPPDNLTFGGQPKTRKTSKPLGAPQIPLRQFEATGPLSEMECLPGAPSQ